jgi:hypothetical protein
MSKLPLLERHSSGRAGCLVATDQRETNQMITLLIALAGLILAVIGNAVIDPSGRRPTPPLFGRSLL